MIIVLFASFKFHVRYNIERKFIDLEKIDKSQFINASEIHEKFNNLKWGSRYTEPKEDKLFLNVSKKIIAAIDVIIRTIK